MPGIKALALIDGKETWRGEVRAVVTLMVVLQFLSNLETFPYLVELVLVPVAILLGGLHAIAPHSEEHKGALPVANIMLTLLGLGILGWSIYRIVDSLGSTAWDAVGKSFALAFWLPAAQLPAIYVAAVVMQYGKVLSTMKIVRPPSLGSRVDLYRHHGLNLRRLMAFGHARVREYARAESRDERLGILRAPTD